MPNHDDRYYEKSDAYRAERLAAIADDPLKCPLHMGDSVEFVHQHYMDAYSNAIVIDIATRFDGRHDYLVAYDQKGSPSRGEQWWTRGGLIKILSAVEVLGEEYFA